MNAIKKPNKNLFIVKIIINHYPSIILFFIKYGKLNLTLINSVFQKNSRGFFSEIKSQNINAFKKINELSTIDYTFNTNLMIKLLFKIKKGNRSHGNLSLKLKTLRHSPKIDVNEESLSQFCISYSASILRELLNISNFLNLVNRNFYYFRKSSAQYIKEKRRYDLKFERGSNEWYRNGLLTYDQKTLNFSLNNEISPNASEIISPIKKNYYDLIIKENDKKIKENSFYDYLSLEIRNFDMKIHPIRILSERKIV